MRPLEVRVSSEDGVTGLAKQPSALSARDVCIGVSARRADARGPSLFAANSFCFSFFCWMYAVQCLSIPSRTKRAVYRARIPVYRLSKHLRTIKLICACIYRAILARESSVNIGGGCCERAARAARRRRKCDLIAGLSRHCFSLNDIGDC